MEIESALQRFRTQLPVRFRVAEGKAVLNGVVIDVDEETGHARRITRIVRRD
jgi:calcineurin-like phosphoesterase